MPNANLTSFEMSLGQAALMAVLGLIIVFAVLGVLVGLLTLFKVLFNVDYKKVFHIKEKKSLQQPTLQSETTVQEDQTDDSELIAVITAAIACMCEEESVNTAPFRIKSIRKLK